MDRQGRCSTNDERIKELAKSACPKCIAGDVNLCLPHYLPKNLLSYNISKYILCGGRGEFADVDCERHKVYKIDKTYDVYGDELGDSDARGYYEIECFQCAKRKWRNEYIPYCLRQKAKVVKHAFFSDDPGRIDDNVKRLHIIQRLTEVAHLNLFKWYAARHGSDNFGGLKEEFKFFNEEHNYGRAIAIGLVVNRTLINPKQESVKLQWGL